METTNNSISNDTPVSALFGVGKAAATKYAKLGIYTLSDLIMHYPRAYENRGQIKLLAEAEWGVKTALILTVGTEPQCRAIKRGKSILKMRAFDESGSVEITYFNQEYLKDKFPLGATFRFYGKVERIGSLYKMTSPLYEQYTENIALPSLYPVYRLSEGMTQKQVAYHISTALKILINKIEDPLPENIRIDYKLCTLNFALINIHSPEDYKSLDIAKRRLIFDEFFVFALGLSQNREKMHSVKVSPCKVDSLNEVTSTLKYKLTDAQNRAVGEIRTDMAKETPMNRILVGDVGCGKTICAALAMYIAVKSGHQAALMAPTEILARQHFNDLEPLFSSLGMKSVLLIGATTAKEKKRIKSLLISENVDERIDVVIGTHALLSDGVDFLSPGLVVTDEQHRFGVLQRATLAKKSAFSHTLVMSATPIPRSLALTIYGDLDISIIDEMPKGRQRVDTFVVDESYRDRLNGFIRRLVNEGGQIYIVCPAVEEKEFEDDELELSEVSLSEVEPEKEDKPPLKAAVEYAAKLQAEMADFTVEFVHGKLKSREKEDIMQRFASGEIQILVSTTVIEVGVNVPNACLMIVENAERFGLSQLHQLRGRVGRGSRKSYCVLVSDSNSTKAKQRLNTMHTTYDGFEISRQDLALRGPGDFFGNGVDQTIRQSGGLKFRIADICNDVQLLSMAFAAAKNLISQDKELKDYPLLSQIVKAMFSYDSGTVS